jgi:hypothetical protein
MARRPDLFNKSAFQDSLRQQGCPESFVSSITSDFRLFVPLVLRALGPERLAEIAEREREELGLGEQADVWRMGAQYMVGWAEEEIERYKALKKAE